MDKHAVGEYLKQVCAMSDRDIAECASRLAAMAHIVKSVQKGRRSRAEAEAAAHILSSPLAKSGRLRL